MPRRAEAIGRDVGKVNQRATIDANGLHANASPSEPLSTIAAAASDVSSGDRLHVGMTEEGHSGDYWMTMKRDRHGRWVPTRGERTTTLKEAREARRNLYVGVKAGNKRHSRLHQPRRAHLQGEFYLSRRNADEVSWKICLPRIARSSGEQSKPSCKECLILKAVTIIDPALADVIRG